MLDRNPPPILDLLDPLEHLRRLRTYQGEPDDFWPLYLAALVSITGSEAGVIALWADSGDWRILARNPATGEFHIQARIFLDAASPSLELALRDGCAVFRAGSRDVVSALLQVDSHATRCLFLGLLPEGTPFDQAQAAAQAALSSNDQYAQYRIRKTVGDTVVLRERLSGVLELASAVQNQSRFLAAAATVCNELAARHGAERVSLGWHRSGYVRTIAVSHADGFERKMDAVRLLEDAMEEAFEQDVGISHPLPPGSRLLGRAHAAYARSTDSVHVASVLVHLEGRAIAVCVLERSARALEEADLRVIDLSLEQVARHLATLHDSDRWFGARWADALRKSLASALGFEHTWIKLGLLVALVAGVVATTIPVPWRATATAILRTDDVLHVTAPFDGFIDSSSVRPGDILVAGQELARLDRKELLLQEAELSAELAAREREVQKAQADQELPGIRIGGAQWEQTQAKLNTVRQHLESAILRNPFDRAVVVEGDLEQRRGTPVNQGAELLTLARLDSLHAEIDIDETEIGNVRGAREAEIALASRPGLVNRVRIVRIHPSAHVRDKANVFTARVEFVGPVPDWFRPGMTGIAKVEGGRRTLWWIASHRALDVLRMKLWW